MAGEVGDADPGENQKSTVIDDQGEIALAQRIVPAYPAVAWSHAPSCAGKQQSGQRREFGLHRSHPVAQLRTVGSAVAEVVILVEIGAEETTLVSVLDEFELDGAIAIEGTGQQIRLWSQFRDELRQRGATGLRLRDGQPGQPSAAVQFPQEQITLAAFEPSVGAPPLEQFTNGRG